MDSDVKFVGGGGFGLKGEFCGTQSLVEAGNVCMISSRTHLFLVIVGDIK